MVRVGALGWMLVMVSLAGCGAMPAVPVEDAAVLIGTWDIDHPDWVPAYMILREGGRFTFAPSLDGSHGQSGDYWMEDGRFFIGEISPFCENPGQYEVGLRTKDGQPSSVVFTKVEDDCTPRIRVLTRREPEWVAP